MDVGPNENLSLLGYLVQIVFGGLLFWVAKTVHDVELEVRAFRVTLFGEDGENGLRSTIKQHAAEIRELHRRVDRLSQDSQ